MIDVEPLIRAEFAQRDPLPASLENDWADVLARVRPNRQRSWRRLAQPVRLSLAAAVIAVAVASVATPLGAAIGRTFDGFSAWITGLPGTPASPQQQQAFEEANARSWASFPPGTQLRKLLETDAVGSTFTLFGFRSGDALCLRLVVTGPAAGASSSCAPLQALQSANAPALVVASDEPFGTSTSPPGSAGYQPLLASATFGIASDGVKQIVLDGDDGQHDALIAGNAFLYIDQSPKLGARVRSAQAVAGDGSTMPLPLAAAPFGGNGSITPANTGPAQGPTGIDRHISGGTIAWIQQRQPHGEPLPNALLQRLTRDSMSTVTFAREVQPDPANPARIAFIIGIPTRSFHPDQQQLCIDLLQGEMAGGGCGTLTQMFTQQPFNLGVSLRSGADQYAYFSGAVSDDVSALKIFLTNGTVMNVPLQDNGFAVPVARALFPARVVAYDAEGRIIGNQLAPTG
jgi:hypothetical protein